MQALKYTLVATLFALLAACGGGGGGGGSDSGVVASTLTFDVRAALRSLNAAGQNASFSVSQNNGCSGSGTYNISPASTSTTFEGQAALSSTAVLVINFTNCTPAVSSNTVIGYTDLNYTPLGASGDKYVVYTGGFNIPNTARVGDVGIVSNALRYTNSSKTTQDGTIQVSYIAEADTATTAIATVITKTYTMANVLESTVLTKYRVNSSNTMSLVSQTLQYPNGTSLVLTRL
jgi:hypothetical protein